MSSNALPSASSYLDFGALGRLRGEAAQKPGGALRETAEQFEAYFLQQMMQAMRKTIDKSEMVDQGNVEMYEDLMDKEISLQMVKRGGIGLADMLEQQMQKFGKQATAQQALQLHPGAGKALPLVPPAEALPLKPAAARAYELPREEPLRLPETGQRPMPIGGRR